MREIKKGYKPTLAYSLESMFRITANEWSFAILLLIIMIASIRLAALINALYSNHVS
ncbi:hypothetical protein [Pseudoalteromonas distincta]|uniref:hypothetical protein n=1 Tax=Pseudoalteromonas distincta TaxID=77608 RepID=UPI0039E73125